MIESVKIVSGYAAKLPALKKPLHFSPGMNYVFGPNGCGKSTLLRIMAGYCSCGDGGWSRYSSRHGGTQLDVEGHARLFPHCITVNNCKAEVAWDGTPTLYNSATLSDAVTSTFGSNPDLEYEEEIIELMNKPSDGQKRLDRLLRLFQSINTKPEIKPSRNKPGELESAWLEYVKSLPRTGLFTILLDEPDRGLSPENQALFWSGLINNWTKHIQVIAVSQSVLPLLCPVIDTSPLIIDLIPGYLDHTTSMIKLYMDGKPFVDLQSQARALREEDTPKRNRKRKPARHHEPERK